MVSAATYKLVTLGLRLSTDGASNCAALRHPGVWVVRLGERGALLRSRVRRSRCGFDLVDLIHWDIVARRGM